MNKQLLIGVCAATGGLLIGLLIASLCGGSIATLTAERDGLLSDVRTLGEENGQLRERLKESKAQISKGQKLLSSRAPKAQQTKAADGPFNDLCQYLRPGSAFSEFASTLQGQKAWNPGHYWVIKGPDYLPYAHLNLAVFGDVKVNMEGIVPLKDFGTEHTTVILSFKPGDVADPTLASRDRNRRIMTVARAMGMTSEEVGRLATALALLPSTRSNVNGAIHAQAAILEFVEAMPSRVRAEFVDCFRQLEPDALDGIELLGFDDLDGIGPAIGIELSRRYVADILFMAIDLVSTYQDVPYRRLGTWWSIVLHHPADVSYTSANPDAWPRVTGNEIDLLR